MTEQKIQGRNSQFLESAFLPQIDSKTTCLFLVEQGNKFTLVGHEHE